MNRICSVILCALFILPLLIGCENDNGGTDDTKKINGIDSESAGIDTAAVMTAGAAALKSLRISGTDI